MTIADLSTKATSKNGYRLRNYMNKIKTEFSEIIEIAADTIEIVVKDKYNPDAMKIVASLGGIQFSAKYESGSGLSLVSGGFYEEVQSTGTSKISEITPIE